MTEADITYDGGANILIEATLGGGVKIPVRVVMNAFSGKVIVLCFINITNFNRCE